MKEQFYIREAESVMRLDGSWRGVVAQMLFALAIVGVGYLNRHALQRWFVSEMMKTLPTAAAPAKPK